MTEIKIKNSPNTYQAIEKLNLRSSGNTFQLNNQHDVDILIRANPFIGVHVFSNNGALMVEGTIISKFLSGAISILSVTYLNFFQFIGQITSKREREIVLVLNANI